MMTRRCDVEIGLRMNVERNWWWMEVLMESYVVKLFEALFRTIGMLLVCVLMATVLGDLQNRAFKSKRLGLVSML